LGQVKDITAAESSAPPRILEIEPARLSVKANGDANPMAKHF
jgi:hypothetical protein